MGNPSERTGIPNGGIVDTPYYSAVSFEIPTTSHLSSSHPRITPAEYPTAYRSSHTAGSVS